MSAAFESRNGREGRRHNLFVVVGMAMVFMGLVVLPQTRANVWSPSAAGYSDILVGP